MSVYEDFLKSNKPTGNSVYSEFEKTRQTKSATSVYDDFLNRNKILPSKKEETPVPEEPKKPSKFQAIIKKAAPIMKGIGDYFSAPTPILGTLNVIGPEKVTKFAKEIGQSIAKTGVGVGMSAGNVINTLAGKDIVTEYAPESSVAKAILGKEPVKDLSTRAAELESSIKGSPVAKKLGLDKYAMPLAVAGTTGGAFLDLFPGSAGEKSVFKAIAKSTDEILISKALRMFNISEDTAKTLTKKLVGINDEKVVADEIRKAVAKITPAEVRINQINDLRDNLELAIGGLKESDAPIQNVMMSDQLLPVLESYQKFSNKAWNNLSDEQIRELTETMKLAGFDIGQIKTTIPSSIKAPPINTSERIIEPIVAQKKSFVDKTIDAVKYINKSNKGSVRIPGPDDLLKQSAKQIEVPKLELPQKGILQTGERKVVSPLVPKKASYADDTTKIVDKSIDRESKEYLEELLKKQEMARGKEISGATKLYRDAKRALVDFAAPIEDTLRVAQKKGKFSLLPEYDLTNQIDRVLRAPTIAGQFARDKGIVDVIKNTDDINALDQYLIAKQARDVDTRGINTGRDIAKDNKLIKSLESKYEETAQKVAKYAQDLLDESVNSGLVSKEIADMLKKRYPSYVPIKRIFTEIERVDPTFGTSGVASIGKQTFLRKLAGSDREIESPLASLLERTTEVIGQSEKNKAARILASFSKLEGNPFNLVPLRTTKDVLKRIELFSVAKDLKPLQNKIEKIIKSFSKEFSMLKTEVNNLNKLGLKKYLQKTSKQVLPSKNTGIEARYKFFPEKRQILEGKPPFQILSEKITGGVLTNSETKQFIEQLIQDRNINLEAIKRKILNREPKLAELINKIEESREQFDGIKELRTTAINEARSIADLSFTGRQTIAFFENGIKNIYEAPKEIAEAAKNLNSQQLNILGQILAIPVRLAKVGITGINLPFVSANIARDQVTAIINSKNALKTSIANPAVFLKSLFEVVKHGKLYDEMVANGAISTSFDIARNQPKLTIDKIRSGRSLASKIKYTVKNPGELLRAVENVINRSEELTRIQQYKGTKDLAIKQGYSLKDAEALASRAARENTVNFMRKGEFGQVLNSAFLYLNASIQGTRTFVRNFKEHPLQTATKLAVVGLTPVAAVTAWNLSDPKRKEAYEDIADYEKENNIVIIPPNPKKNEDGTWNVIKIPLSQEINNIVGMARRGIEQAHGLDPVSVQDISTALIGSVSPIGSTKREILSTLTPQAIKPTLEGSLNRNIFTGLPIVPQSMEKLSPEYQVKPYTSGTARIIGRTLKISPLKVEAFIKGTFGGVGSQAINVVDNVLAGVDIIPKDQIGGQNVVKAIITRFASARGGKSEQLDKTLSEMITSQADESFRIKQEAEIMYNAMKNLPKEEAKAKFEELTKTNLKLAKEISDTANDEKLGLTYADRVVKTLGVQNGNRAKYIVAELNKLEDKEEKKKLWEEYVQKKIITKEVSKQINYLLK